LKACKPAQKKNAHGLPDRVGLSNEEAERRFVEIGPNDPLPQRVEGVLRAFLGRFANILATLEAAEGSTTRAAEILDISVRTIQYRMASWFHARRLEIGAQHPRYSSRDPPHSLARSWGAKNALGIAKEHVLYVFYAEPRRPQCNGKPRKVFGSKEITHRARS